MFSSRSSTCLSLFVWFALSIEFTSVLAAQCVNYGAHDAPRFVSRLQDVGRPADLVVQEDLLFGAGDGQVWIADVSNVESPVRLSFLPLGGTPNSIAVGDGIACVGNASGTLHVLGTDDPKNLVELGTLTTAEPVFDVALFGSTAFLAEGASLVRIVNLEDPKNPQSIETIPATTRRLAVSGQTLFVVHRDEAEEFLRTYDLTDPTTPQLLRETSLGGGCPTTTLCTVITNIAVQEEVLAVTYWTTGCLESDCHGFDMYERAFVGTFDVSDPANPSSIGGASLGSVINGSLRVSAVAVNRSRVYAATDPGRVFVIDGLDELDARIAHEIATPFDGTAAAATTRGDREILFVAEGSVGIYDVTNPDALSLTGGDDLDTSIYDIAVEGDRAFSLGFFSSANRFDPHSDPTLRTWSVSAEGSLTLEYTHFDEAYGFLGRGATDVEYSNDDLYVAGTRFGRSELTGKEPRASTVEPVDGILLASDSEPVGANHLWVARGLDGLSVLKTSREADPILLSTDATVEVSHLEVDAARGLFIQGAASPPRLFGLDASDPTNPRVGDAVTLSDPDPVGWLTANRGTAAAGGARAGVHVLSMTRPGALRLESTLPIFRTTAGTIVDSRLYLATNDGRVVVVDMVDPTNPSVIAEVSADPAFGIDTDGNRLLVAEGNRLSTLPLDCALSEVLVPDDLFPGTRTSSNSTALFGPNPFRSSTTIALELPQPSRVSIELFDVQGRRVRSMTSNQADHHRVLWDGRRDDGGRAVPGTYFAKIRWGANVRTQRVTLLR